MLKVGQELEVVVLDINREKERVSLGLKQTQNNPWDEIEERFPVGAKVKGKVTNLVPYGAFVEIEEGVEGLIHVSELSWTKRIARPSDVLTVGQEIEAVVLGVNKEEQKISLGVRQLEPNPWDEIEHRYPIGTQVKGKVRNMTAYGAFVELEEGIDGMIHVSDMSWTRKINHPSEVLKKGDEVEAVVIDIDKQNQRISLGMKQLDDDPWKAIDARFKIGDLVKGKVTKIASFGAFVELEGDIDGLVHISQISEDRVDKVKDVPQGRPGGRSPRHQGRQGRAPHRSLDQGRELQRRRHQAGSRRVRHASSPAKTWSASSKPSRSRPRNTARAIARSRSSVLCNSQGAADMFGSAFLRTALHGLLARLPFEMKNQTLTNPAVTVAGVGAIYAELDDRPVERNCVRRTECCQFKLTGRTPYLTMGEALVAAKALRATGRTRLPKRADGICPLLGDDGRCIIYAGRPFGCRTHFCAAAGGPCTRGAR